MGQAVKDIVSFGNEVVPTTWMASGGQVLPMEFSRVCHVPWAFLVTSSHLNPSTRTATPTPTASFLSDFLSVLALNGCDGLFGIDTFPRLLGPR